MVEIVSIAGARNAFHERVNRILRDQWDPIGCGVPDDEYKGYVPEAARLALAGERDELIAYLERTARVAMFSPLPRSRHVQVADMILEARMRRPACG